MKEQKNNSLRLGRYAIYATLALIVAKVAGLIHIRWLMVFTPVWLWLACVIAVVLVALVVGLVVVAAQEVAKEKDAASRKRDDKREM